VIGEGGFAEVQSPLISPNGKKVIYRVHGGTDNPALIYYYDGEKVTKLFEGSAQRWIGNDKFIYETFGRVNTDDFGKSTGVYLYDSISGQSTLIFK